MRVALQLPLLDLGDRYVGTGCVILSPCVFENFLSHYRNTGPGETAPR